MIHKLLFTDPAQTVLPSGFGIASFGFLVFTQSGGSILIHFLLSLGGAIAIATIVRLYRLHILDRILPLAVEEETIFKAIDRLRDGGG